MWSNVFKETHHMPYQDEISCVFTVKLPLLFFSRLKLHSLPMTLSSTNWPRFCCTYAKAPEEGKRSRRKIKVSFPPHTTLSLPDQICNSLYCWPYNSCNVSLENLVLDQLIISKLIVFSILITCLVDIVLIL